jgi:hypothetical protein
VTGPGTTTVGNVPQWGNTGGSSITAGLPVGTTGNSTIVETSAGGLLASTILPAATGAAFGAVEAATCAAGQFFNTVASGVLSCGTPSVTGTLSASAILALAQASDASDGGYGGGY